MGAQEEEMSPSPRRAGKGNSHPITMRNAYNQPRGAAFRRGTMIPKQVAGDVRQTTKGPNKLQEMFVGLRRSKTRVLGLSVDRRRSKTRVLGLSVNRRRSKTPVLGLSVDRRRSKIPVLGLSVNRRRSKTGFHPKIVTLFPVDYSFCLDHMPRFHLEVAVDDVDGKALGGRQKGVDAVALEQVDHVLLLGDEFVGYGLVEIIREMARLTLGKGR